MMNWCRMLEAELGGESCETIVLGSRYWRKIVLLRMLQVITIKTTQVVEQKNLEFLRAQIYDSWTTEMGMLVSNQRASKAEN